MTTDRRLEILRAIVDEYVETQEPVGSKAIADKRALGISPATIRNEMAVLEEEGLITQPHTSAGRIPTDLGYRLFVDKLSTIKPLSTAERRAIETFLGGAHDLDDVVKRSAKLLADITKQVAVVQYPILGDSHGRDMMAISGTANLARSGDDLGSTLSPILEALEEQVVLLRLLSDAHPTVHVTIGSEQHEANLQTTSLVTVGYGQGESSMGALGIIGPTRMDYAGSISAVSAVARYIGRYITDGAK
ncbi:Heat-inducible transcription repressor HrcA [Candidatus Planktophila versatilis]|uniref:HrcA family transcriptional regulator n=1 Tax=Candidatus Planktophila versatilis TaxID=1884905 RepID=UPI003BEF4BDF